MTIEFHEDMTLEKFWSQWFGLGRELGSNVPHSFGIHPHGAPESHRMFTTEFKVFLDFIEWTKQNKVACWCSTQPMRDYGLPFGLEKIVYDFDYPLDKKKEEEMDKDKKEEVKKAAMTFAQFISPKQPFVIETYKGFHVILFLAKIWEFDPKDLAFATDVFSTLAISVAGIKGKLYHEMTKEDKAKWKFMDWAVAQDINRQARVPLSIHEKSGELVRVLNRDFKPTKVRSLDLFKGYGILQDAVIEAKDVVLKYYDEKIEYEKERLQRGSEQFHTNGGELRPCFMKYLQGGQLEHQHRLALLSEIYFNLTEEEKVNQAEEKLMDVCRKYFADYIEEKSLAQVRWYLNHEKVPPYRCETIKKYGWCIGQDCPKYKNGKV